MSSLKSAEGTRVCRVCGEAKPPDDYYAGQGNTCKECTKARSKRASFAQARNPDAANVRRQTRLRRRYKLTPLRIIAMLMEQDWECLICRVPIYYPGVTEPQVDGASRCVVDHAHRDGHVRGLLCSACNSGLGLFDDNLKWIKAAFHYLKNDLSSSRISGKGSSRN